MRAISFVDANSTVIIDAIIVAEAGAANTSAVRVVPLYELQRDELTLIFIR